MKLINKYNDAYKHLILFNYHHFDNDDNFKLFISYLNRNNIFNFKIYSISTIYSTNNTEKMIDLYDGSRNIVVSLENYIIDNFINECNRFEKLNKIMNKI